MFETILGWSLAPGYWLNSTPPDPLANLADIKLPDEALFIWPLPPIYWLGLLVLIILIGGTAYFLYQKQQRKLRLLPVNAIIAKTEKATSQFQKDHDAMALLTTLLSNLKLIAILRWGRRSVAQLNGSQWFAFLEKRYGKSIASPEIKVLFQDCIYQAQDRDSQLDSKLVLMLKNGLLAFMIDDLSQYLSNNPSKKASKSDQWTSTNNAQGGAV